MVCYCANVTKGQIIQSIEEGCSTLEQLRRTIGVCPEENDCATNNPNGRCCAPEVMALLKGYVPDAIDNAQPPSCCSCCGGANSGKKL